MVPGYDDDRAVCPGISLRNASSSSKNGLYLEECRLGPAQSAFLPSQSAFLAPQEGFLASQEPFVDPQRAFFEPQPSVITNSGSEEAGTTCQLGKWPGQADNRAVCPGFSQGPTGRNPIAQATGLGPEPARTKSPEGAQYHHQRCCNPCRTFSSTLSSARRTGRRGSLLRSGQNCIPTSSAF